MVDFDVGGLENPLVSLEWDQEVEQEVELDQLLL